MNPSPIPPGSLSLTSILLTGGLSLAGRFDGHPWALVAAIGLCVVLSLGRGAIEAWKGKAATVAMLAALLFTGCATMPGHYVAIPPDPAACAAAIPRAALAQAPCDVKPPPDALAIISCAAGALAALSPCMPVSTWVADRPVASK